MHRLNFLKSLVAILLGSKLVTFFRPEKVTLVDLMEEAEDIPLKPIWPDKLWSTQYMSDPNKKHIEGDLYMDIQDLDLYRYKNHKWYRLEPIGRQGDA